MSNKYTPEDQAFFAGLVDKFGSDLLSQDGEFMIIDHGDGRQTYLHRWKKLPVAKDGKLVGDILIEKRIAQLLQT